MGKVSIFVVSMVVVIAVLALVSWFFMLLANVVLGYYGVKLLDYPTAVVLFALISGFTIGGSASKSSK